MTRVRTMGIERLVPTLTRRKGPSCGTEVQQLLEVGRTETIKDEHFGSARSTIRGRSLLRTESGRPRFQLLYIESAHRPSKTPFYRRDQQDDFEVSARALRR